VSFALQYRGEGRFRQRAHLEWVEPTLRGRARGLGWDGKEPLRFHDSDGLLIGGFVPAGAQL
jgi:hypothetical protein